MSIKLLLHNIHTIIPRQVSAFENMNLKKSIIILCSIVGGVYSHDAETSFPDKSTAKDTVSGFVCMICAWQLY